MRIGIFGAGAIGGFLGGMLAAADHEVTMVGRPRLEKAIADQGMTVRALSGPTHRLDDTRIAVTEDPAALADHSAVLVTVKSRDTQTAGEALAEVLATSTKVVSFQNGVSNAAKLRAAMPDHRVFAGMVSFNVRWEDGAAFHQATSGPLAVDRGAPGVAAALRDTGLKVIEHEDMAGVQWGKLLLNLNNAINALSGLPLAEQLRDRRYRRVMAATIAEGIAACRAAEIKPRGLGLLQPAIAPPVLRLPTPLFSLAARPMLRVAPDARSSMWEDLQRGRPTEIAELNGEVVRLGARTSTPTPVNAHLVSLVEAATKAGDGSPELSADALWPASSHDA